MFYRTSSPLEPLPKNEKWGPNEYDPNERVSLKYVCLFSSQSTENELIHPNNTNGKKILDTAGPSVVK